MRKPKIVSMPRKPKVPEKPCKSRRAFKHISLEPRDNLYDLFSQVLTEEEIMPLEDKLKNFNRTRYSRSLDFISSTKLDVNNHRYEIEMASYNVAMKYYQRKMAKYERDVKARQPLYDKYKEDLKQYKIEKIARDIEKLEKQRKDIKENGI